MVCRLADPEVSLDKADAIIDGFVLGSFFRAE